MKSLHPFFSRAIPLALMALVLSCPFAISAPWHSLAQWYLGDGVKQLTFLPNPVDNQNWYVIFGSLTILAMAIIIWPNRNQLDRAGWAAFGAVCLWFAMLIGRGLAVPEPERAGPAILLKSAFFIVFILTVLAGRRPGQLVRFQWAVAILAIPIAAIALFQNAGYDPLPYSGVFPGTGEEIKGKLLIASTFGHPNYMGSYLAPVLVLIGGLIFEGRNIGLKVLAGVIGLLIMAVLVVGGTRGSLAGVLVGFTVFFALWTGQRGRWALYGAGGLIGLVAVAGAIYLAAKPGFDFSQRLLASKEVASRVFYWVVGLEMFKAHPLPGVGLGQFDVGFWWQVAAMPETKPDGPWYFVLTKIVRGVRPGQMHNDHLQVLVESGLLGALAWVSAWAMVFRRLWLVKTLGDSKILALNASVGGFLTAALVDGFFGFPFELPCSGLLVWYVLGAWLAWPVLRNNRPPILT